MKMRVMLNQIETTQDFWPSPTEETTAVSNLVPTAKPGKRTGPGIGNEVEQSLFQFLTERF